MLTIILVFLVQAYLHSHHLTQTTLPLVFAAASFLVLRRKPGPVDLSMGVYFAACAVLAAIIDTSFLKAHFVTGIYLALLMMAVGTWWSGTFFTETYAQRQVVDAEKRQSAIYQAIVRELGVAWTILFALAALGNEISGKHWVGTALMLGIGLPLTMVYPNLRKKWGAA